MGKVLKGINNSLFSKSLLIIAVFIVILVFTYSADKENNSASTTVKFKGYSVHMLDLPTNIDFAGEKVPMNYFDAYENFDREMHVNTYWHSQTILLLKRAHRYFPVIEKILKENDIPDDFKYLAVIESGLANSVSPSGATGFWQFLEATATDYGLRVDNEIDERYHLEKSTKAACKYFKKAYDKFKSWTMVAASYNMGRSNLIGQINRQKTHYYYDLLLGEETERYVHRILAIKYIFRQPQKYGFYFTDKDLYKEIPYKTVTIDTSVTDFAEFAYDFSINYKMLKYLNPWLRQNYLSNSKGEEFEIKIMQSKYRPFEEEKAFVADSIN